MHQPHAARPTTRHDLRSDLVGNRKREPVDTASEILPVAVRGLGGELRLAHAAEAGGDHRRTRGEPLGHRAEFVVAPNEDCIWGNRYARSCRQRGRHGRRWGGGQHGQQCSGILQAPRLGLIRRFGRFVNDYRLGVERANLSPNHGATIVLTNRDGAIYCGTRFLGQRRDQRRKLSMALHQCIIGCRVQPIVFHAHALDIFCE